MQIISTLLLSCILAAGVLVADVRAAAEPVNDPENTLYLDLDHGRVVIRLRPDLAPNHVARIKQLTRGGFFDGLVFHRVIDGFMAQTGDPKGTGTGGSGRTLAAEFTRTPAVRGIVAAALGSSKNSGDSQFFIVLSDNHRSDLDRKYTVWGEVVSGMEFVDRIKKGDERRNGSVSGPDRLLRLQVAADADTPAKNNLPRAELLKRADAGAVARAFGPSDFKCVAYDYTNGATAQPALAQLWTHGYLSGLYRAQNKLTFAPASTFDDDLAAACKASPAAYLLPVAAMQLAKTSRDMPAASVAFPAATLTCKEYTAVQSGADKAQADFVNLWTFAFVQGFKHAAQPGLEIPFEARQPIITPFANVCAKNPDTLVVDLAAQLGEKVKLK
jgi:peptidylprolyl isomerase